MEKTSYPSDNDFLSVPNQYDTQKWLTTIKTIYYGEKNGLDRKSSIHKATSG